MHGMSTARSRGPPRATEADPVAAAECLADAGRIVDAMRVAVTGYGVDAARPGLVEAHRDGRARLGVTPRGAGTNARPATV